MKNIFVIALSIVLYFTCLLGLCQAGNIYDTLVVEPKLAASDGKIMSKFGQSVAISENYAVVGASEDNDKGRASGSVYVFSREVNGWTQQQKLTASDGASLGKFGHSVSISGNFIIVGAYGDNSNGDSFGSAYIFYFDGTTWIEKQKLTASDGSSWDKFGCSVALSGNYAIIGAYGDNDNGEFSGSAYVFYFNGTTWVEVQKLTPSDGTAWKNFGYSVSISGDHAIIGAHGDDESGGSSGSAYMFYNNGSSWSELQKVTATDGNTWDKFGQSVATSGNSAIVGAPGDDDKGEASGSVYVYYFGGTSWALEGKLVAIDGAAADYFGYSVGISGDNVIVGAYGNDDLGLSSGSAYIYHFDGASWTQVQKLTAGDGAASDYFGSSAAIAGNHIIVGAYGDDDKGESSGSTHIISGSAPNVVVLPQIIATHLTDTDRVINFDATQSSCYEEVGGVIENRTCTYQWNFGGAGSMLGGNGTDVIYYEYNQVGVYTVSLTLTEPSSGTIQTVSISVSAENVTTPIPFADFVTAVNGRTVTLQAVSLPAEVTKAFIYWGDGTRKFSTNPLVDLFTGGISHTYTSSGTHFNLRVLTVDAQYNKVNYTFIEDADLTVIPQ